jgi:RHS repeat-associated protein
LLKVVEADGSQTTYTYDINGRLTSVTQSPQVARKFDYDVFGFLRAETTPEGGKVTYDLYGSLGNLRRSTKPGAKSTDPNVVITRTYDAAGRITGVSSDEGGTRSYIANSYDLAAPIGLGKLGSRTTYNYSLLPDTASVTDTYSYDAATGRTASRRTIISRNGASQLDTTQRWLYNSLGLPAVHFHPRPAGATPFGVTTSYAAGLPTSVTANGLPVLSSASYAPSGVLTSYVLGQNTGHNFTTTIQLDSYLPRPVQISTSGASQVFDTKTYFYDGAGNIVQIGADGASPDTFSYDSLSRLTSSTLLLPSGAYATQGYSYDRYGNLKTKGVFTYNVDAATNRLISRVDTSNSTTVAATYDQRGNLTDFGAPHDDFDGLDRQTTHTASGADWRYLYDGSAERVARLANAGGSPYYSFRDEGNRLVTEYVGSSWSRDNVYLGGLLIASLSECSYNGQPDWSYWASDHLGSVRQQVGTDGNSYDLRKYWPFGDDTQGAVDQGLNHPQRLGFAGMERDNEAPRFYDHARSHDFAIGRFVSPDRIGGGPADPQSWNRYTYARNNPLTRIDLDGRLDEYAFQRAYAQLSAATDQVYRSLNQLRTGLIFELGLGPGGGIKVHAPSFHGEVGGFVGVKWTMGSGVRYSASGDATVTAGGKTAGDGVEFSGKLDHPIESAELQTGLRGNGGSQLNANFSQEGFEGAELSTEFRYLFLSVKGGVQDPAAVVDAVNGLRDAWQSALGGASDFLSGVSTNFTGMITGQPTLNLAPCDGKAPCNPTGSTPTDK